MKCKIAASTVREKINGIREGILFPYIESAKVYHCPSDKRSKNAAVHSTAANGMIGAYRTYSIVSGLNSPFDNSHTRFHTIKNPSIKYVFLEEADGRGYNVNSWAIGYAKKKWVDPIGIFHYDRGNLGFADGHGEKHVWVDPDTIEMARQQTFGLDDPDSEDLDYMLKRYPYLD